MSHAEDPRDSSLDVFLHDAWYRAAFDCLPFPTLILDPHMVVREANQSFLEGHEMAREQVIGRPCFWVFHRFDSPCPPALCRFGAALAGQKGCVNLHQHPDQHGQMVYEEVHLSPLRTPSGRIVGVVEYISDITPAKRLESELTEANEFLNRLLDSMVGVVVAADLAGRVIFVNKNVEKVLGYSPEALVGKKLWQIAPREDLRRVRRTLEREGGRALGLRTVIRARGGEEVPVRINSSFVYREGRPVGTVGVITDLREHLKIEENLVQARMQVVQSEKLAHLGRMAAGVAHELNNPLTGITIYAELLKESLPVDSPAQGDLSAILEDADRCRDIVRGLLDYSRQSQIAVEELELSHILEEALGLIRDETVFMHVEIARQYDPNPLPIEGDPRLLRQVFINLIMNAVDAMEGRGSLTLHTFLDADGMRVAEVGDSGPGIQPADLARVFDPFFTTKEVGKGTGLGLSVAFGVVSRHGGEITVSSTGPQGTVFQVRLPEKAAESLFSFAHYYHPGAEARPPESES